MDIIETERIHTSGVYRKRELAIVSGHGASLQDQKGRQFIDCMSGIGVANVGHSHPSVVAALTAQAKKLINCPESFFNDSRATLLQSLAAVLPTDMDRLFLCNSGTEAVEGCLKFARISTGRTDFIASVRGFHGRTLGALSATHKLKFRKPFQPLVPGFHHVRFNNIEDMERTIGRDTAAVVLESVQGEGGVRPATPEYLQQVRRLCAKNGALLIVDEVQTGFGRTGRYFGFEHMGVVPDLVAMGKAIAGGFPMGAIGIGPTVKGLVPGSHGSTFGGNPLACAAGLATLKVIDQEQLVPRAARLGNHFLMRLGKIQSPLIREVRGLGLMVGVDLKVRAAQVVEELMKRGVLALTAGTTVLRFLPPLVINQEDLDTVVKQFEETLTKMETAGGGRTR